LSAAMETQKTRTITRKQLELLEKLCNAIGVSGDEEEVRNIVRKELADLPVEIQEDGLGNLLVRCKAKDRGAMRVMVAAHMDEVGFMIVDEKDGFFQFEMVGGVDVRYLPGKSVSIGKEHLPGLIGVKPVHLTTDQERKTPFRLEDMRIDMGQEAGKKVRAGTWGSFATQFRREGMNLFAKALDDRLGVAILIELIKSAPYEVELTAAFTVQEEVGLRGARVAAFTLDPRMAFVIDSTPANDLPAWDGEENTLYNTRLGDGPAIYVADAGTISDPRLVRFLTDVADHKGLSYQFRQPGGGGTDAAAIHRQRAGIPSVSISVPHRYPHTGVQIARVEDWLLTLELMKAALTNLKDEKSILTN
jgi:putative aminopeptidase FrvX